MQNKFKEIIIYYKNLYPEENNVLNIVTKDMYSNNVVKELMTIYSRLSFGKNNYWSYVLSNKTIKEPLNFITDTNLNPLVVTPRGVKNIIWAMNPSLKEEDINEISKKLYTYKKWKIPTMK